MNTELLTYLVCQMVHATKAKDRRTANDILIAAIATAQAHALSEAKTHHQSHFTSPQGHEPVA